MPQLARQISSLSIVGSPRQDGRSAVIGPGRGIKRFLALPNGLTASPDT